MENRGFLGFNYMNLKQYKELKNLYYFLQINNTDSLFQNKSIFVGIILKSGLIRNNK